MLRISSVWRIRQIKFQNSLKNASILYLFFEILLGSEQVHINIIRALVEKTSQKSIYDRSYPSCQVIILDRNSNLLLTNNAFICIITKV